ncbi:helix-turn-helix transcriptional regulator [Nocardia bovistercoris]|uniref:Helix-turn-helix domain-containing protein n=1 Tax=Nocardia bovistercoris TaxID=2785916 RepID=A0A931II32_9NOCA|nr:helix-turn-helix transcriptional regulator [Nocardia bovistercoris]MBH0780988.1 helix-turn-helix domain-containing protein [Nocardia bovistercoris]
MDRTELADFLRRRRDQLSPAEVGLPPGVRRRTPGLRRDEVAQLAGISTDYYTRLEQSRGPRPSTQVLTSLARALRFDNDERDHLYHLCGHPAPGRAVGDKHVGPGLLHMLAKLDDTPATVVTDLGEVLVQNRMHALLVGDHGERRGLDRFYAWRWFTDPPTRAMFPREDWARLGRNHVADLRATAARRAADTDVVEFIAALRAASTEFDRLWHEHQVAVRLSDTKRILHPSVGLVDTVCETLLTPNAAQRLLVYLPRPGTDAAEKLDLLRVIGTQSLAPVGDGG